MVLENIFSMRTFILWIQKPSPEPNHEAPPTDLKYGSIFWISTLLRLMVWYFRDPFFGNRKFFKSSTMRLTRVLVCFWLLSQWICGQAERERHFQEAEVVLERARGSQGVPRMSPSNERQPIATPRIEDTIWDLKSFCCNHPFMKLLKVKTAGLSWSFQVLVQKGFPNMAPKPSTCRKRSHPRSPGGSWGWESDVGPKKFLASPCGGWLHKSCRITSSHGFTPTTWD